MKHIKIALLIAALFTHICISAQLSTNEKPVSFSINLKQPNQSFGITHTVTTPKLDMKKIEVEDKEDEEFDMPPRFGFAHKVNYDLNNSGIWYELPNGDKLWQLNVVCPDALSVNFCYDKFWIPDGGKFFIYTKDKKQSIGAFTSNNNKATKENLRGFATGPVYGNDMILEYYQPKEVLTDAIISIDYIVHGYRYISFGEKDFSRSGNCMVNVNCEEGKNWQHEKNAVALILVNGNRYCTGSLINTTDLGQKPYLLTANHCLGGWANNYIKYDADTLANLDHYSFWWNFEAPGCSNNTTEPIILSTSGATVIANNSVSDFALLRLSEDPKYLSNFEPFYLGWDRTGESGDPGVCIHHPSGDVKKISTIADQPISTLYLDDTESLNANHWRVQWSWTPNGYGTTEGGSSGAALLTAQHKIIGQLHGGFADCDDNLLEPDRYGKFDISWTGNNNSTYRRLDCWLDSLNVGVQTLEGLLVIPASTTMTIDEQLFCNLKILNNAQLNIQSNITLSDNSSVIVETGGKLIIDGGILSNADVILKEGATLQLINGGIVETRNGFEAPIGSVVDVGFGQIR